MDAKVYLKVSAVNLAFLSVGVLVGTYIKSDRMMQIVHAQEQFEEISPVMTAGSMGIGTVLAGRVAADQVMIHGIDQLKFDENIVNYLGSQRIGSVAGWQSVVADSRVPKPLRMAQPQAPAVTPNKPDDSKKGDAKK